MQRSRSRLIAATIAVAVGALLAGPAAPAGAIPAGNGCNATGVPAALIAWYPGQPASQSTLHVACTFNNNTGTSQAAAQYTLHDMNKAQYHNGSSRHITVNAAAAGATTLTANPSIIGTGMALWANTTISGPGIDPRTFVVSIAGDTITLNLPVGASGVLSTDTLIVENANTARSVGDATGGAAGTFVVNSATANFTGADMGKSISGTGIPANSTIASVAGGPWPAASSATFSNPAGAGLSVTGLSTPVVTVGGTLITTSTRSVTEATVTAANTISSTIAVFVAGSDVGLRLSGTCNQNTVSTGDDTTVAADTYITGVTSASVATTTGPAFSPTTQSGCTFVIGDPNATAPVDGGVVADQGVQLNLNPSLVAGSDDCANDQPEGFTVVGKWQNPGTFLGAGLPNLQPGASTSLTVATKSLGQIVYDTSATDYASFVLERLASTPAPNGVTGSYPTGLDPIGVAHYDIQTPFAPLGLALCGSSATSPGLGLSFYLHASTTEQATIASGTGRPGTGQLRSILPSSTGGYTATAYMKADSISTGPQWTPIANFQRLCIYPTTVVGSPNAIDFKCGPG